MKLAKKILYYSLIGFAGVVGLAFVATLMPIPGNVEVKVVKSGSMEPAIGVGSIVVIRPAASYAVGDIITFGKDTKTQIPTTHRIVAVQGEGNNITFTTKGDANDSQDNATTPLSEVKGKMLFTVPLVGYALAFARTKLGFMLLVGLPALLVFLEEGRSIYRELRRARRSKRRVDVVEDDEVEVLPVRMQVRTSTDIRRKKVMGAFAMLLGLGVVTSAGYFGNTVAYYENTATSHGNSMKAGIFELPQQVAAAVLGAFEIQADELTVSEDPAPEEPKEESAEIQETTEETPLSPVVEVSEPVVVEAIE